MRFEVLGSVEKGDAEKDGATHIEAVLVRMN
jgi:hypothetical protein